MAAAGMKRPRVLVLTADYPPRVWSGIGTAVAGQAAALRERGLLVEVVRPPLPAERFPVDVRRFDVIHLHSLSLSEVALRAHDRYGVPLVYTVHASFGDELRASSEPGSSLPRTEERATFWAAVQDRLLSECDRVVFLNESERARAVAARPALRARSAVIAHGLARPPAHVPCAREEGLVVFAGRFAWTKGLTVLQAAMPRVFACSAARLVLAGGHGDAAGTRAVDELVRDQPTRCRRLDWLESSDVPALLAAASLVVMPSFYEPFGLVALEAMQVGTPVLAAAVGGLKELTGTGSGAVQVDGHEPESWSSAIVELLSDPAARRELGRRGPLHVAAHYSINETARRLEKLYAAA